ncbi:DUF2092 domain-containing protein [Amorphus sp. 3PC139-8]|uniref:DUF2092 domain-containing protein n=1 Tax=Amorphus sp. 3PC139-8 TaxID=2735676 RepID=UPI00345CC680
MGLNRTFLRGLAPLFAAALFSATPAFAQSDDTQAKPSAEASAEAGLAAVGDMATYLGGLTSFEFNASSLFDEPTLNGPAGKRAASYHVAVKRPNKLFLDAQFDDGSERKVWFDGANVTFANTTAGTYIELPFDGDIDGLVTAMEERLGTTFPLLSFVTSTPFSELDEAAIGAEVLGERKLGDDISTVVAVETIDAYRLFWIADGSAPLPERLVTTYLRELGDPEMITTFHRFSEKALPDATFTAEIADGWQAIELNPAQ